MTNISWNRDSNSLKWQYLENKSWKSRKNNTLMLILDILTQKLHWKSAGINKHSYSILEHCDEHTKISMLKGVYLIKSWYNWCFLRRQCSGSVGASRAGNPKGGGSSWVGGKVVCWWKCEFGGYLRLGMGDWEGAASFF